MGAVDNALAWVSWTLMIVGQIILAFMVLTISYDALMRYVFTAPTSWSQEVNTFLIIYIAAMVAAETQRTDDHIRITFFQDMCGPTLHRISRIAIAVVGVVFCAILTYRGWELAAQAFQYDERVSSSFGTPMVLPYGMLPVGFGVLALQFLMDAVQAARGEGKRGAHHGAESQL